MNVGSQANAVLRSYGFTYKHRSNSQASKMGCNGHVVVCVVGGEEGEKIVEKFLLSYTLISNVLASIRSEEPTRGGERKLWRYFFCRASAVDRLEARCTHESIDRSVMLASFVSDEPTIVSVQVRSASNTKV